MPHVPVTLVGLTALGALLLGGAGVASIQSHSSQPEVDAQSKRMPTPSAHVAPIVTAAETNAPPADVFRALTTSEGVRAALGIDSKVELRIGGPYEFYFIPDAPEGSRGSEECVVLSYLPDRMLTYTWNAPPQFPTVREQRTWVVWELAETESGGTSIRSTHLGWPEEAGDATTEWGQTREYFVNAWPYVMGAVVSSVEPEKPE